MMTQVNVNQLQAHFADVLASLTQGETSIILEKEGTAIATLINYNEMMMRFIEIFRNKYHYLSFNHV